MKNTRAYGWSFLVMIILSVVSQTSAYPQQSNYADIKEEKLESSRRYAEKPNNIKKVALDDIDQDIQTNQISDSPFSWTNMLGMVMQMIFNNNGMAGPNKSDDIDGSPGLNTSPWANIISIGLRIITTLLGGNTGDGIDKVDNGAVGPMQFINIVVNLLDALKTSFSHRSLQARSIGRKDSVSDAAVASLAMMKSYAKTYKNSDDLCMQKYLCEANSECANDIGGTSIFCQLGTYATSFLLERSTQSNFESLYEAGRQGRSGVDCRQIYLQCNEV
jgi:hypothetical protein